MAHLLQRTAAFQTTALVLLVLAPGPALAQRSLSWDEVSVEARLDADGRLHVRERQVLVMSGDWNGGERRFVLEPGQGIELRRIARVDPSTGEVVPLVRGGLNAVDHFDWTDRTTLRWRSRLPTDPPFRDARLTYVLDYSYANVLQPRGGDRYELDHDFLFADRPGEIRHFTLDLTLHPDWTPLGSVPSGLAAEDLPPGGGYVVSLGLEFRGEGRPAGVDLWAPRVRTLSWAALVAVPLLVLGNAWWRERRLGRLDPLPGVDGSAAGLARDLRSTPAEVIGAAWDEHVGAAEVAAVIARLQAEGRIETRVGRTPRSGSPEMTLVLKAPLAEFTGHEHDLLRALFGRTSDKTSTQAIRERYRNEGFDPAAIIRPSLEQAAEALVGTDRARGPSWVPGTMLFWGGVVLLVLGGVPRELSPLWMFALFGLLLAWAAGHAAATAWRRRVDRGLLAAVPVVVLALVPVALAGAFLVFSGSPGWRALTHAGVAAVGLSFFAGIVNQARSRRGPVSIRLRKRLSALRRFFADELSKPEPALEDAFFPYLVAFGLEKQVARWFGRFGGAAAASSSSADSSWSGSTSTSHATAASTWTGGGGSFGGAGASASWAAAVGGLAAGVSPPSSSDGGGSGGGGGGGGSSSGGGGGGGW